MKRSFLFVGLIAFLFSCSGEDSSNTTDENGTSSDESTDVEVIDFAEQDSPDNYKEYHPNGELSIEGKLNENGNRQGLWISYYDTGVKWSESYYTDGKRDGHSLTFYPNGQVRYVGEYSDDERIGNWKFYDEEGNLTNEENF